jgi:hypothetical protein
LFVALLVEEASELEVEFAELVVALVEEALGIEGFFLDKGFFAEGARKFFHRINIQIKTY